MSKKTLVRLVLCCAILALALGLTATPSQALNNCPAAYCPNVASACNGIGCGYAPRPIGQCLHNGVATNLYFYLCPGCNLNGQCYYP